MAVSKTEIEGELKTLTVEPLQPGESFASYFERIGGQPSDESVQTLAALERIQKRWSALPGSMSHIEDTTELIRKTRENRTNSLLPQ